MKLSRRNPEVAVGWLQLARELGGAQFLERYKGGFFGREFFERALDPRYLLELSERSPEAALAWVELTRDLGGARFEQPGSKRFGPGFFERVLNPGFLLELSERNPQASLAWLAFTIELGGQRFLEKHGEAVFDRVFDRSFLANLVRQKPASFAMALRLARGINSRELSLALAQCLDVSDDGLVVRPLTWLGLPLASLPDLHWLATTTGNAELMSKLSAFSDLASSAKPAE